MCVCACRSFEFLLSIDRVVERLVSRIQIIEREELDELPVIGRVLRVDIYIVEHL